MKKENLFHLGERVRMIDAQTTGTIYGLYCSETHVGYAVRFGQFISRGVPEHFLERSE